MVNHTFYDEDLWNWCPNPELRLKMKTEGAPILIEIEDKIKEVCGTVPFDGNEFNVGDIEVILAVYRNHLKQKGILLKDG